MRKVLCLILVLVFCVSMACPAFAVKGNHFVDSPSDVPGFGPGHGPGGSGHPGSGHPGSGHPGSGHPGHDSADNGNAGGNAGSWIPKTGDVIMMWVLVMVISLIALAAVVVVFRKKFAR